jgi:hypothetical protein
VVINDVVFDGGFVCSRTLEGICERSILLHFSFLFGGSDRFSDAIFRELWRLVSFALGGGDLWSLAVRLLRVVGLYARGWFNPRGSLVRSPVSSGVGGCVPILEFISVSPDTLVSCLFNI